MDSKQALALAAYNAARKSHGLRPVKTLDGIFVNAGGWQAIAQAVLETYKENEEDDV